MCSFHNWDQTSIRIIKRHISKNRANTWARKFKISIKMKFISILLSTTIVAITIQKCRARYLLVETSDGKSCKCSKIQYNQSNQKCNFLLSTISNKRHWICVLSYRYWRFKSNSVQLWLDHKREDLLNIVSGIWKTYWWYSNEYHSGHRT